MKVLLGVKGLGTSFQDAFPETTPCVKCGKPARVAFVAHETDEPITEEGGKYVCGLHENDHEHEAFWLHDVACFAVYLCPDSRCGTATSLWNQA